MRPIMLTFGHSAAPEDAFMFYALAKDLIPRRQELELVV